MPGVEQAYKVRAYHCISAYHSAPFHFPVLFLKPSHDYGFIEGIIFYAIIAFVEEKMEVDTILTYNVRVFKRLVQDVFVIPPCTRY